MEQTAVQRLAKLLKLMITAVLALNLFCLLLVPAISLLVKEGGLPMLRNVFAGMLPLPGYQGEGLKSLPSLLFTSLWTMWQDGQTIFLAVFYWVCGCCTAVVLYQARLVLNTILAGNPFCMDNARSLKRAAVSCWVVSGAALIRLIEWLNYEKSLFPLFTYTTLFIPAFLMGGLLFMVMSALFRQAAELKEDQDLTI